MVCTLWASRQWKRWALHLAADNDQPHAQVDLQTPASQISSLRVHGHDYRDCVSSSSCARTRAIWENTHYVTASLHVKCQSFRRARRYDVLTETRQRCAVCIFAQRSRSTTIYPRYNALCPDFSQVVLSIATMYHRLRLIYPDLWSMDCQTHARESLVCMVHGTHALYTSRYIT